jgi:hypothetical protein
MKENDFLNMIWLVGIIIMGVCTGIIIYNLI